MTVSDTSIAIVSGAVVSFSCLNKALDLAATAPPRYVDDARRHMWRNAIVSFVHAFIIGFGGLYCFISNPSIFHDKINVFSQDVENLLSVSVGYLLYDIVDLIKNNGFSKVLPQVIHHCLATLFVYVVVSSRMVHGIACLCMIIEVSGVFLHVRILLLMYDFKKQGVIWNVNAFINVLSFLAVRMGIIVYVFILTIVSRSRLPPLFGLTVPWIGAVIFAFNVEIFRRLIRSDYLKSAQLPSADRSHDENILDS